MPKLEDRLIGRIQENAENPFGKGVFGKLFEKQKTLYYQRAKYPVLPVEDLAKGMAELTDEQWGLYAFHRDPIGERFTEEEKLDLIARAQACADEYAEKCRNESTGEFETPSRIAKKLGAKVSYPALPRSSGYGGNSVLFARFTSPDAIEVYTDCADKAEEVLSRPSVREILGKVDAREVLLAHELFHLFEEKDKDVIFTETQRKTVFKLGPIQNRSRIVCLGEIAAMRFARDIMGLDYSPYVFDVLFSYVYDKQSASNLFAQIRKYLGVYEEPENVLTEANKYDE